MIDKIEILKKTMHGLNIIGHVLCEYYRNSIVLELVGNETKPARNPFNADKVTLVLSLNEDRFCYRDTELPEFHGDPFDFAALHYKMQGDELLEKINQELNLQIGMKRNFYGNYLGKFATPVNEMTWPHFSFFRCPITNTKPSGQMSILDAYKRIKGNSAKARTSELRSITDPETASQYKRTHFDYVTFSGIFTKRSDKCLAHPSGLLTLDFDHVPDVKELRQTLITDLFFETELMFISPSGNGLKWIIPVDLNVNTHQEWFSAVAAYLKGTYDLEVDKSGKDISRACFLCHDPEVYIHSSYLI
ncbi:MAG TPA: BT4734/BF3469 family protein [Prolixibacteraceae bacterium]|jgi:hypothetical protein